MKTITRGPSINTHISLLLIAGWIALLIGGALMITPREGMRAAENNINTAATAQQPSVAGSNLIKTEPAAASNSNTTSAKWTVMVYIDADDDNLEEAAVANFIQMAGIGSNDNVNIVVQLDRIPGYDSSYGDWTDCRRFLITKGETPADGNEVMDIGEVNMGDANTLANFTEWAATNYPAQRYALILSGHGKGWEGLCWDKTSGNDYLNMNELKTALAETAAFDGKPLALIGFDSCLMDMTEVAYEIHDSASVMVASEHAEPSAGWPYDKILAGLIANPDMNAAQLGSTMVDSYYTSYSPTGYTMAAIDLTQIGAVVQRLNSLSLAMLSDTGNNSAAIKTLAKGLTAAIDGTVIDEKNGAKWPDSHGLAIYFPKASADFDSAYNANNIAFAKDTSWKEFLIGYYAYPDGSWIASARAETQQYYCKDYIDLYSFCQHLAAAQ
jgi:hypothetical protein